MANCNLCGGSGQVWVVDQVEVLDNDGKVLIAEEGHWETCNH